MRSTICAAVAKGFPIVHDSKPTEQQLESAGRSFGRFRLDALQRWARAVRLERKLALLLLLVVVGISGGSFFVLTRTWPNASPRLNPFLLGVNVACLIGLLIIVLRRIAVLVRQRFTRTRSQLETQMVGLFTLIAVLPTLVVSAFAFFLFEIGLQAWFSQHVRSALENSLIVADAYRQEHIQAIVNDAETIARMIDENGPSLVYAPSLLANFLSYQAQLRNLSEAAVYDSQGRLLGASEGFLLALRLNLSAEDFRRAEQERIVFDPLRSDELASALRRLFSARDAFLYVARPVDARVLAHLSRSYSAVQLYEQLEQGRFEIQITFGVVFAAFALILLLASIWVGLSLADSIADPVMRLIRVTKMVAGGDLSVRAPEHGRGEIGTLGRTFNRMTETLAQNQKSLVRANARLDERTKFAEAVLAGVGSGVLGIDHRLRIRGGNQNAIMLLGISMSELRGRPLSSIIPEVRTLSEQVRKSSWERGEMEVSYRHAERPLRKLLLRVALQYAEKSREVAGFVVTFDDMTELSIIQRKAAGAEIARRVAHEIKNPLTPIQLAAGRLRKRFSNDDPDFINCVDVIIRQTQEIHRLVEEFSSFARMPQAQKRRENLSLLIDSVVRFHRETNPDVAFQMDLPQEAWANFDKEQIERALTNFLRNSLRAIAVRWYGKGVGSGMIGVVLRREEQFWAVVVTDDGIGLPDKEGSKLFAPYVTTFGKGAGLGLAIVARIAEEHGGRVSLERRRPVGACASLYLPVAGESVALLEEKTGSDTRV